MTLSAADSVFEVWLPAAYRMGLDMNLFWRLNPRRMKPFFKAFEQSQREERDRMNNSAYLTGVYVRDAVVSCLVKNAKYPDKPRDLRTPEEIAEWQMSDEYVEQQRLIQKWNNMENERNARHHGGGEMNGG